MLIREGCRAHAIAVT